MAYCFGKFEKPYPGELFHTFSLLKLTSTLPTVLQMIQPSYTSPKKKIEAIERDFPYLLSPC